MYIDVASSATVYTCSYMNHMTTLASHKQLHNSAVESYLFILGPQLSHLATFMCHSPKKITAQDKKTLINTHVCKHTHYIFVGTILWAVHTHTRTYMYIQCVIASKSQVPNRGAYKISMLAQMPTHNTIRHTTKVCTGAHVRKLITP